ncbi:MAG: hypothetical protein Q4B54_07825 [Coriobacteriales bacterium]|nr:hypothetical protein [Coriobacteriales bacterium]
METWSSWKQQLQDLYAKSPEKTQYTGLGWNNAKFQTPPTAAMLDEIFGKDTEKIVVLIDSSGHSLWMNTYAMEQVGIAGKVDSGMIPGGVIEVDEEGNSIGCVRDNAVNYVLNCNAL